MAATIAKNDGCEAPLPRFQRAAKAAVFNLAFGSVLGRRFTSRLLSGRLSCWLSPRVAPEGGSPSGQLSLAVAQKEAHRQQSIPTKRKYIRSCAINV